jgi:hypothetical protein
MKENELDTFVSIDEPRYNGGDSQSTISFDRACNIKLIEGYFPCGPVIIYVTNHGDTRYYQQWKKKTESSDETILSLFKDHCHNVIRDNFAGTTNAYKYAQVIELIESWTPNKKSNE